MERLASIFAAIECDELLAALPECPLARDNHQTAMNLLAIVEVEVRALCAELQD